MMLFFGWLAGGAYTETYPRLFNSVRWKAADHWQDEARCGMIADLQYRRGIIGKRRAELIEMLGEPQLTIGDPSSSYWELCPSLADTWILEVRWHNGRVVTAIVRDT